MLHYKIIPGLYKTVKMATIWRLITQVRWLHGLCGVAPCLYKKEVHIIFNKDYPNDFRVKKNTKSETMAYKVRKYGNHITLYYLQHNIPGPLINISGQLGQQALGTRYSLFCIVILIIHFAFLMFKPIWEYISLRLRMQRLPQVAELSFFQMYLGLERFSASFFRRRQNFSLKRRTVRFGGFRGQISL